MQAFRSVYPTRRLVMLALLCLTGVAARCEPLPSAPVPVHTAAHALPSAPTPVTHQHVFTATDWALSVGVFATHAADYLSTEQGVREPSRFREANLPQALVHSHVGLAAYEFASAGLEVWGAYELTKMGHRRMARVVQAVNIGYTAKTVTRNYEIDWSAPKAAK
jgi:hypothetical protein